MTIVLRCAHLCLKLCKISRKKNDVKKRKAARKKKRIRVSIVVIALVALMFIDSNTRLVSTEHELFYDNLPQSFDGFRIVQLSDLHMAQYGKDNARLIEMVKAQEPDIIALTGDFLNARGQNQTSTLIPFLEKLAAIAPCYFISGNHEWASGEINELAAALENLGIRYLRNEFVFIQRGDDTIILAGVEDPNGPLDQMRPDELAEAIKAAHPGIFTVLLAHRNYWFRKYPDLPVDIILCGHTHGGIVRLPFVGGVFGADYDLFPAYDAGVFNQGGYDLVISRGLSRRIPLLRFLNNPEVVTVILRTA